MLDFSSAPTRFVSPIDLGFQAVGDLGQAAEDLDYTLLTRAWREQIQSRVDSGDGASGSGLVHRLEHSDELNRVDL